jgi:small subunit ribosomal protein S6
MRHYEIVLLVHPDQSEQVGAMVERYRTVVEEKGGVVHRHEDWGRRQLAYPIEKIHKAHYLLFNIECDADVLDELKNMFKFSDAVIRNLVIKMDRAVTDPSPMMQNEDAGEDEQRSRSDDESDDDESDDEDGDDMDEGDDDADDAGDDEDNDEEDS